MARYGRFKVRALKGFRVDTGLLDARMLPGLLMGRAHFSAPLFLPPFCCSAGEKERKPAWREQDPKP